MGGVGVGEELVGKDNQNGKAESDDHDGRNHIGGLDVGWCG